MLAVAVLAFTACTSNNFTANLSGVSDFSTVAVKDFITLGIITVRSSEIHQSGPLGFSRSIEGSKITFADLMQEAARLEADDIINIRIDMHTNYRKTAFGWITGWTRTYNYVGTALAIKYTDGLDTLESDPQLERLPSTPESSGAVRRTRDGRIILK